MLGVRPGSLLISHLTPLGLDEPQLCQHVIGGCRNSQRLTEVGEEITMILSMCTFKIADKELLRWMTTKFPVTPHFFICSCGNENDSVEMMQTVLGMTTKSLTLNHLREGLGQALSVNNISIAEWLDSTFHLVSSMKIVLVAFNGFLLMYKCNISVKILCIELLPSNSINFMSLCNRKLEPHADHDIVSRCAFLTEHICQGLLDSKSVQSGKVVKWLIQEFHLTEEHVTQCANYLLNILIQNHKTRCAEWLIHEFHVSLNEVAKMVEWHKTKNTHVATWMMLMRVFPEMTCTFAQDHFTQFVLDSPLHIAVSMRTLGLTMGEVWAGRNKRFLKVVHN
ncbi:hypothetical protein Pelo_18575 [Pelomyxa schiedti]|nr:hypothetical protein Pelo_18575 [Pelomyxa schiedti]